MLGFFTKKQGFTLIELLVVLAIVGLLISVLAVALGGPRKEANDARRQMDIHNVMEAMEMAYHDDDRYPSIEVDAESKITNTSISSSVKTYLSLIPEDPQGGNYYGKANTTNLRQYCIYAILEAPSPTIYLCTSEKGVRGKVYTSGTPELGACCY